MSGVPPKTFSNVCVPPADVFHILNPNARHRARVQAHFENVPRGSYAWVERTSHPTHLETLVEWALREGRHTLSIWGGDGTFNRAVQALYDLNGISKVRIELVAAGTCNDFMRNAPAGPVDIGLLSDGKRRRVFLNNAGFGRTPSAFGSKRSNPIQDIFRFTEKTIHVTEPRSEDFPALLGVICNGPFFSGGLHFAKNAKINDGLLNGFFVPPQNRAFLVGRFVAARLGTALSNSHTIRIDGPRISLESDSDLFPQVDGEPAFPGATRKLTFSILDERLQLISRR
jgi:diacylglycerol kinase family enzyme